MTSTFVCLYYVTKQFQEISLILFYMAYFQIKTGYVSKPKLFIKSFTTQQQHKIIIKSLWKSTCYKLNNNSTYFNGKLNQVIWLKNYLFNITPKMIHWIVTVNLIFYARNVMQIYAQKNTKTKKWNGKDKENLNPWVALREWERERKERQK